MARAEKDEPLTNEENLIIAARALLRRIDDMTTLEFSRGEEHEEREALREALSKFDAPALRKIT